MSDSALALCAAAGCRAAIYPHEDGARCAGCGRLICSSCADRWPALQALCSACETRQLWRSTHDLYMEALLLIAGAAHRRRCLLHRLLESGILPEGELLRAVREEIS